MTELFIAYRHIKERKFQSIISIFGIFLSLTIFLVSLSISNGLKKNTINSILSINPHITVQYLGEAGQYKQLEEKIKKIDENIVSTNLNVDLQGFIKYKEYNIMPIIKATDVQKLNLNIVSGKVSSNIDEIVIGEELAKTYGINLGEYINVISLNGKELSLKVSAFFKTGYLAYDKNLVIIPLEVGQILLEKGDLITNIDVKVKNPDKINSLNLVRDKINKIDSNLYAYTWADENVNLLGAIFTEEIILILILSMLFLIASFVVTVILSMSVREKTSDIGILRAYGYSKKSIKRIFILEGLLVGFIGILISAILTPIVLKLFSILLENYIQKIYYISKIPLSITVTQIFFVYLLAIVTIFLASYIPARKASSLDPAKAIKFNL